MKKKKGNHENKSKWKAKKSSKLIDLNNNENALNKNKSLKKNS